MKSTFVTACLTAASAFALSSTAGAATIAISCGAVGMELELCKTGSDAWAAQSGHTVNIVSTPNSTTERLALYQQILSAGGTDIDVYQIDVIWPGILGSHFVDLSGYVDQPTVDAHFQPIISNNTIDGKLLAMPWFTDAGVLYYRADLVEEYDLEVPETWEQLTAAASVIHDGERAKGNDRFWGFVWQGRAYEGLTCDALEWIDSHNGGTIVEADGDITINNPKAIAAVDLAAGWVGTISPPGVLNYAEEEARGVFQSGNAAFMRNWPYAWSLANSPDSAIRGKVGVAALPRGGEEGKNTGTLGGWQLAVSRYSPNVDAAADLVAFLTSYEEQKRRAIVGSYNPTIGALYEDSEVLAATPFFGDLYDTFTNAVARPSGVTSAKYNEVSSAFWNAVHATLSGNGDAAANLASLERELTRMSRGGRW
ncbi:MAG: ABC transporter substrate-binding protein [Inquilinus sp.]|nr:ABC transporter substrate-binding protein [Inquilinus sp.]